MADNTTGVICPTLCSETSGIPEPLRHGEEDPAVQAPTVPLHAPTRRSGNGMVIERVAALPVETLPPRRTSDKPMSLSRTITWLSGKTALIWEEIRSIVASDAYETPRSPRVRMILSPGCASTTRSSRTKVASVDVPRFAAR